MTITLRQRRKKRKISLYLDIYHKGKRKYEYLKLYLIPKPENGKLTRVQKNENKATLALAEKIRAKKLLEIQHNEFGFESPIQNRITLTDYFQKQIHKKNGSMGNFGNWKSALVHINNFIKDEKGGKNPFLHKIDAAWVSQFKEFLLHTATTNSRQTLARNSAISYFQKFKAALRQAEIEGLITTNPAKRVKGIKRQETKREFLTLEEVKKLAETDCDLLLLKTAFLFSCLTGLRWSDIENLTWGQVQYSEKMGSFLHFRQQKTKGIEILPISEQAKALLGERKDDDGKVFQGLTYHAWNNLKLREWVMKAGIKKDITFHCARHTYATLQLSLGTDIYTVSKLLGHKELKTTQVYAKLIDETKIEAANKIKI